MEGSRIEAAHALVRMEGCEPQLTVQEKSVLHGVYVKCTNGAYFSLYRMYDRWEFQRTKSLPVDVAAAFAQMGAFGTLPPGEEPKRRRLLGR